MFENDIKLHDISMADSTMDFYRINVSMLPDGNERPYSFGENTGGRIISSILPDRLV